MWELEYAMPKIKCRSDFSEIDEMGNRGNMQLRSDRSGLEDDTSASFHVSVLTSHEEVSILLFSV